MPLTMLALPRRHYSTLYPPPSSSGGPPFLLLCCALPTSSQQPLGGTQGRLCLPPAWTSGTLNNPPHCFFVSPTFESRGERDEETILKKKTLLNLCAKSFPSQGACEWAWSPINCSIIPLHLAHFKSGLLQWLA